MAGMDDDDELEASKQRHPSSRAERLTSVSGVDPVMTPGEWRRSKVTGYIWFEPALFDQEELELPGPVDCPNDEEDQQDNDE